MNLEEAKQLAQQEANESGEIQAVVLLTARSYNMPIYIPIELRWANGLHGSVVREIKPEEK